MTEVVGIAIAVAGLIITIIGGLIGLGYRMGGLASDVRENTKDIEKIQSTYVTGLKDVNDKLDKVLVAVSGVCERVATLEGKLEQIGNLSRKEAR